MLVQALAAYADTYLADQLGDPAFEEKPVQYAVEIDEKGRLLGIVERMTEVAAGPAETGRGRKKAKSKKPRARTLIVPKSPVNRNTGVHPLLGCDAIQYVVGPRLGVWTKTNEKAKHAKHHEGFAALVARAAEETGDDALAAAAAFYSRPERVKKASDELAKRKAKTGSVVLSYRPAGGRARNTGPLTRRKAVRDWWRRHFTRASLTRHSKGGEGCCLVSGRTGPIAVTHEKIKGLSRLGGQASGVSLMSFDKDAFCSYGWKKNLNSPVSTDRAAAYVLALNDLLVPGLHRRGSSADRAVSTRRDYGDVGFLYWTTKPADDDLMAVLEQPDDETVSRLLAAPSTGKEESVEAAGANDFYLLAVSGNGGRMVVRQWFHEALATVRENILKWFQSLRVPDVFQGGSRATPPRLSQLLGSMLGPGQKLSDKVNSGRAIQLVRRALYGLPVGRSLLPASLARLRVSAGGERLRPARVGLVRMCVNDLRREGEDEMPEALNEALEHPAYVCGRLLALFDGLQYQAQGNVGVTVADRYYALASTYPQVAFPKIEQLARAHLKKLRRDKRGAAVNIERELATLHERLGERFPAQLSLEDQGRFAIGFHHQKAEVQRRIAEAKEKNAAAVDAGE